MIGLSKEVEEEFADDKRMQADLLNAIAQSYHGLGLYRESMLLYGKVQELRSSAQGPRDPGTIEAMCNYASAYESAGQFDKAIPLYQEVLRIQQERLAADDPELLATTTKLAWDYNMSGQTEKALALFQDVLRLVQAKVKTNGPAPVELPDNDESSEDGARSKITVTPLIENTFEHLDDTGPNRKNVLVALNNLAKAFAEAGQVDQAIPLYQQTLKLMQEKLGPDDPSTLTCMYNLAMAFKVAGRFDEAIPLFDETLRLRKERFGPDSEIVARTMTCVGVTYGDAGNQEKCVELFGEVLRIRQSSLGRRSPRNVVGHVAIRRDALPCRPRQGGPAALRESAGPEQGETRHRTSHHARADAANLPKFTGRMVDLRRQFRSSKRRFSSGGLSWGRIVQTRSSQCST